MYKYMRIIKQLHMICTYIYMQYYTSHFVYGKLNTICHVSYIFVFYISYCILYSTYFVKCDICIHNITHYILYILYSVL